MERYGERRPVEICGGSREGGSAWSAVEMRTYDDWLVVLTGTGAAAAEPDFTQQSLEELMQLLIRQVFLMEPLPFLPAVLM